MDEYAFQERIVRASRAEEMARRILGVEPGASKEELKSARRREVKKCHPDRCDAEGPAGRRFRAVQRAYRCLCFGEDCEQLLKALEGDTLSAPGDDDEPDNSWAYFLSWRDRFF